LQKQLLQGYPHPILGVLRSGFVLTGSNVGVNETITVSGEVLSFFNTGIDTRVYFIKNF